MPLGQEPYEPTDKMIIHGPEVSLEIPPSVVQRIETFSFERASAAWATLHELADAAPHIPFQAFYTEPERAGASQLAAARQRFQDFFKIEKTVLNNFEISIRPKKPNHWAVFNIHDLDTPPTNPGASADLRMPVYGMIWSIVLHCYYSLKLGTKNAPEPGRPRLGGGYRAVEVERLVNAIQRYEIKYSCGHVPRREIVEIDRQRKILIKSITRSALDLRDLDTEMRKYRILHAMPDESERASKTIDFKAGKSRLIHFTIERAARGCRLMSLDVDADRKDAQRYHHMVHLADQTPGVITPHSNQARPTTQGLVTVSVVSGPYHLVWRAHRAIVPYITMAVRSLRGLLM